MASTRAMPSASPATWWPPAPCVDEDPEAALAHARAARDRASRVAVVREAVGVAAYHAGDFAEAAREIRAYRRMSGDQGYRAVLADCERALGRAGGRAAPGRRGAADAPDAEEAVELRLVEAGARRDLGEDAAARLVLEAALGGRPDPDRWTPPIRHRLRLAAAYADLLQAQGEEELAEEWLSAVAAADPDDLAGVEFTELEIEFIDLEDERTMPRGRRRSRLSDSRSRPATRIVRSSGGRRGARRTSRGLRRRASTTRSRPRSPSCSARSTSRPTDGCDPGTIAASTEP